MPVIYFNNFRGFNSTYLPLNDINFFVGENSTGKTSVLKLIRLISHHDFWFYQDFNSEHTELGYFSEIANSSSKTNKSFEIGVLGDQVDKGNSISAIKFRFTENKGLPFLSEIFMVDKDLNIHAIIDSKNIKYKYNYINLTEIDEEKKLRYFKHWIENNGLEKQRFKTKKLPGYSSRLPIIMLLRSIISSELQKSNSKAEIEFDFMIPSFLREVAWLAPIRTEPKKTYDSYKLSFNPDGTHAPYLLKGLLDKNKSVRDKKPVRDILQKFGEDSGLYEKIDIKPLGTDEMAPFEIYIYLSNKPVKITNVGYGVSQILPLIVEVIARAKDTWFAIQQPEIHLHPRGQAAFGDFIYKAYAEDKKKFIIETHSDYTIDRFRLRLNRATKENLSDKFDESRSQVVFFTRNEKGNSLQVIPILNDGTYPDDQPEEFRDFFIKEQLDLLTI